MKISVVGSGGWGTALALLLLENGHEVTLWSYAEEESRILRETRENPMLKGVALPAGLGLTTDLGCVRGCKIVVLATPSFAVRSTAHRVAPALGRGDGFSFGIQGHREGDLRDTDAGHSG